MHSRSIEYSEYIGRKSIMLTTVTRGKPIFLGYRELVGRQKLMQDCEVGVAGLRNQLQLEEVTLRFDQLISTERVRRQLMHFAYSRGLEPVLETSKSCFGSVHATPDWEY